MGNDNLQSERHEWNRHFDNLLWTVTGILSGANSVLLVYAYTCSKPVPWPIYVLGIILSISTLIFAASFRSAINNVQKGMNHEEKSIVRGTKCILLKQWPIFVLFCLAIFWGWIWLLIPKSAWFLVSWNIIGLIILIIGFPLLYLTNYHKINFSCTIKDNNYPKKTVSNSCKDNIFISDQSIDKTTLLIKATYKTHNGFLNFFCLPHILPVTDPVSLELYFENLYTTEIPRQETIPFTIIYPHGEQTRPWRINLPHLKNEGDSCSAKTKKLFMPEVPGHHQLCIAPVESIQYADYHGLTDRPFKQIGNNWVSSFYIHSSLELNAYKVAVFAIVLSALLSTTSICLSIFL